MKDLQRFATNKTSNERLGVLSDNKILSLEYFVDSIGLDIAEEIDFDHAYNAAARIRSYESGQALPTLGMLQKLADLYEVEVADLMLPNEPR